MSTPEKEMKLHEQAKDVKLLKLKASRMTGKLENLLAVTYEDSALPHDDSINEDTEALVSELDDVVQEEPQDSFKRIFWEQQVRETNSSINISMRTCIHISYDMQKQASKVKGHGGMRWHPLILRWCLYMKYFSTNAYETLRGVLKLPSTRTLRDYTHWAEAKPGTNCHSHNINISP